MSKTRWPDAFAIAAMWAAIAVMVYSVSTCFSSSIQYKASAPVEKPQPVKEDPNHGVHFKLVDP